MIQNNDKEMEINIDGLNLATNTKWHCLIPFRNIMPELKPLQIDFSLTSFTLPELSLGMETITQFGYSFDVPNYTMSQDKSLEFEYMVSSDFSQYQLLWEWSQMISNLGGSGMTAKNRSDFYLPITLIFLSEFKKPLFAMKFNNCWIQNFSSLNFDFQADDETIKHAFTVKYSNFKFLKNISSA